MGGRGRPGRVMYEIEGVDEKLPARRSTSRTTSCRSRRASSRARIGCEVRTKDLRGERSARAARRTSCKGSLKRLEEELVQAPHEAAHEPAREHDADPRAPVATSRGSRPSWRELWRAGAGGEAGQGGRQGEKPEAEQPSAAEEDATEPRRAERSRQAPQLDRRRHLRQDAEDASWSWSTRRVRATAVRQVLTSREKYKAHNENNEFKVGDRVRIVESRPLSKDKRWRVEKLIERPQAA